MKMNVDELQQKLNPGSNEQGTTAAVAALLKQTNARIQVLLVKRVKNMYDPWSGQVAFPGGKRDAKDNDLQDTVVRETFEETGIDLRVNGRFLGVLPALTSRPRPQMKIAPFVILLVNDPPITLNSRELESYEWFDLELVANSKSISKVGAIEVPAFAIGEMIVWGLTFRILEYLIQLFAYC